MNGERLCAFVASVSSRRRPRFPPDLALTPIAVLDLSMPVERRAHDFLLRMTTGADKSWLLLTMRQREGALLCVVRWVHGNTDAKPYSVVDISLLESAVHWRDYKTADLAFAALAELDATAPTVSTS